MQRTRDQLWWAEKPDFKLDSAGLEWSKRVIAEAKRVEFATIERSQTILENYCLYGDFGAWGVSTGMTTRKPATHRNVIATGVDTIVSELLQTPPRAMWISRGGTWRDRRTAKKLTSWGDDLSQEQELDDLRSQVYRDGLIAGVGFLQPYVFGKELRTKRIFPCNVLMDDRNCGDSMPRQLFTRNFVDRYRLMEVARDMGNWNKDMEDAISEAPDSSGTMWSFTADDPGQTNDLIEVWECWHLPSKKGAKDGVHAIVIDGATLLHRTYERDRYPLVAYRPIKPTKGWWGASLVSRAGPLQAGLNDIMSRIDEAMEYHARMVIIHPPAGGTFKTAFTNEAGTIVEHPQPERIKAFAPEPMPAQAYEHRDHLRQAILEEFAVNELQSQGTVPGQLESGKALRVLTDTGSRRFIDLKRCAERVHSDYMREAVHCMRQLSSVPGNDAKVIYKRHGVPIEVDWSELNPDDSRHRIKTFPTSSLPQEPAGRIQTLDDLRADGMLKSDEFYALALDVPDVEGALAEITAPIEFIRFQLDTILDDGEPVEPWPTSPLERGIQIANAVIFREAMDGCPEDKLDMIRDWIDGANAYLKRAADMMAAEQAMMAPPMQAPIDPMMAGAQPPMPMGPNPDMAAMGGIPAEQMMSPEMMMAPPPPAMA